MTLRKIVNGTVFGEDGSFAPGTVYMCDEKIVSEEQYLGASGEETVTDAAGCYVIPGLTDIHFHGCMGSDCCDGTVEALRTMARYEVRKGVTSITPATMTMPEDVLAQICRAAREFHDAAETDAADFCGLYMEGPFINMAKKGAQNGKYIHKPDADMFRRLQEKAGGLFKLVDIAPEEEGSMKFIEALKDEVTISLAHTTADFDIANEAYQKGARHTTHLYNAMPSFSHRAPGVIGAACDNEHVRVELIADGIHIHPAVVRTTFKMFGSNRVVLISDSMMATGLTDGDYSLGGQAVKVVGQLATLADGTIAGSATNLMGCVRSAVKNMGIPLGTAIKAAAVNSAKAIGIYDNYGSITPGKKANLVLLDKDLNIVKIFFKGNEI